MNHRDELAADVEHATRQVTECTKQADAARAAVAAVAAKLADAEREVQIAEAAFAATENDAKWSAVANRRGVRDRAALSKTNAETKLREAETRLRDAEELHYHAVDALLAYESDSTRVDEELAATYVAIAHLDQQMLALCTKAIPAVERLNVAITKQNAHRRKRREERASKTDQWVNPTEYERHTYSAAAWNERFGHALLYGRSTLGTPDELGDVDNIFAARPAVGGEENVRFVNALVGALKATKQVSE